MKHCLTVTLLFLAVILSGCSGASDDYVAPADFYYKTAQVGFFEDDGVIACETRETAPHWEKTAEILNLYLKGPKSDKLVSPFPDGLSVLNVAQFDQTLSVTFDETLLTLNDLDMTIAGSCLCATVYELTGYKSVSLQVLKQNGEIEEHYLFCYDDLELMDASVSQ